MSRKHLVKAIAYFRTSSDTNVGADKDSQKRQREASHEVRQEGRGLRDHRRIRRRRRERRPSVDQRPGFAAMMEHIASNGVRTIIVETANRFARDLDRAGDRLAHLRDAGITLIAADSPDAFLDETPTAVMIRQILGSVAQFEKAMLVAKLKGARAARKPTRANAAVASPIPSETRKWSPWPRSSLVIPSMAASGRCGRSPLRWRLQATLRRQALYSHRGGADDCGIDSSL